VNELPRDDQPPTLQTGSPDDLKLLLSLGGLVLAGVCLLSAITCETAESALFLLFAIGLIRWHAGFDSAWR
jgi:hypothetical protein